MTDVKCPIDETTKNYIIPTGSWLKAIEQLNVSDLNTTSTIFLSELLEKEKILVKVTSDKKSKLRDINHMIKGLPNFVYTYCVIFCNDYLPVILKNKQFCNLTSKYKVTLELMKYYNGGSLTKINIPNIKVFKKILKQLVYAQINLFRRHGITHNDIHPGNILIHKLSKEKELIYAYLQEPITIKTDYEFILSDYDKCVIFKPQYINENDIDNMIEMNVSESVEDLIQFTLLFNIMRTINVLLDKIKNKEAIIKSYLIFQDKYQQKYYDKEKQYLTTYIKQLKNKDTFTPFKEYVNMSSTNSLEYFTLFYGLF